jgi:GT2 family glycosyltransferase
MAITCVSTVLCTRNRAALLSRAVDSILQAGSRVSGAVVELILVDNGSTDDTASVARRLAETSPIPFLVLSEPRPGVCKAKNAGLREARGDVIVFTDDDCILAPDYFEQVIAAFEHDDQPVIRGGRVELGDAADIAFTIKTERFPDAYDGSRHPGGFLHGCNMAVSRAVFDEVGLFDEEFGPGGPFRAAEDTELVYRAHKSGIPVLYTPDMVVHHHHGRRALQDISDLMWAYQFGNGALHAKHGCSDYLLAYNFLRNVKYLMREWVGGRKFDAEIGLSHREIVVPQFLGIVNYLTRARRTPTPALRAPQRSIGHGRGTPARGPGTV